MSTLPAATQHCTQNYSQNNKARKRNTNELYNLHQIEKFLERYNIPELAQEGIKNLNRCITSKKSEPVIK